VSKSARCVTMFRNVFRLLATKEEVMSVHKYSQLVLYTKNRAIIAVKNPCVYDVNLSCFHFLCSIWKLFD
jgi:hypothetical protein